MSIITCEGQHQESVHEHRGLWCLSRLSSDTPGDCILSRRYKLVAKAVEIE